MLSEGTPGERDRRLGAGRPARFGRGGAPQEIARRKFCRAVRLRPGIWGLPPPTVRSLAVAEINSAAAFLAARSKSSIYDAGGPIDDVTRSRRTAIAFDEVDLVMGSHISAVAWRCARSSPAAFPISTRRSTRAASGRPASWRSARRRGCNAGRRSSGSPNQEASRWYLIGSDYVWPWLSHRAVKKYIADAGGRVVGEEFVPLGEDNHEPISRASAPRNPTWC